MEEIEDIAQAPRKWDAQEDIYCTRCKIYVGDTRDIMIWHEITGPTIQEIYKIRVISRAVERDGAHEGGEGYLQRARFSTSYRGGRPGFQGEKEGKAHPLRRPTSTRYCDPSEALRVSGERTNERADVTTANHPANKPPAYTS